MTYSADETPLSIARDTPRQACGSLVIGVVNNMPGAAFQATADQFSSLLHQAVPDGTNLHLRFFCPPGRNEAVSTVNPASARHEAAQELWVASLDGLIVTGAEPQAAHITDEPCLPFLSHIVDWADAGALPTLWSCLAAHAAVYRLDGIVRRQRDTKLFGVFECDKVQHHPLLDSSPAAWTIPHSRHNELSEDDLTACGYQILTRSRDVGADTFVKQMGAPHVFLNGHPEYGQATLSSEYRRDVRRFLAGERPQYPAVPTSYFPEEVAIEMETFRETASVRRTLESMAHFPAGTPAGVPWRITAIGLFRNWLQDVARRKRDDASQFEVTILSEPAATARLNPSPTSGSVAPRGTPPQMQISRQTL